MELTLEFKQKIVEAVKHDRATTFEGEKRDAAHARSLGIKEAQYSRVFGKKNELEGVLGLDNWLSIATALNVSNQVADWITVRTQIYVNMEQNMADCQEESTAFLLVDDCGIGKTYCSKVIVKKAKNRFYIDCSQAKNKTLFAKTLAKAIGLDNNGTYNQIKTKIKLALNNTTKPLIVLDEFGDLDYAAFLDFKEYYNACEYKCGWYLMGAQGLQAKIDRGISNEKVGFAEIHDRFGKNQYTPKSIDEKKQFKSDLLNDVAYKNKKEFQHQGSLVKKCLDNNEGLRQLKRLIALGWTKNN